MESTEITVNEQTDLQDVNSLEHAIEVFKIAEQNLKTNWAIMAGVVNMIKEKELWKEAGHPNFESFIRLDLGYSKQWVYKLLKLPEIISNVNIDATNPTAATELTSLPSEKWEEAWSLATNPAESTTPTKVQVRKAVRAIKHGYQLTDDKKGLAGDKLREDLLANEVDGDPSLESSDHRLVTSQKLFDAARAKLHSFYNDVQALSYSREGIWLRMDLIRVDCANLGKNLSFSKPFCECIPCDGNGCEKCLDSGVLIRERFEAYGNKAIESTASASSNETSVDPKLSNPPGSS